MKKRRILSYYVAITAFIAFAVWTLLVMTVDVSSIGPNGSSVGLSSINGTFHNFTGVNLTLYEFTDWLSIIPICIATGFAVLGLIQWIQRKNLFRVDYSLFILGGFYVAVFATYFLFELLTINYRPILIEGILEASYPSSTTMLVLCIMPTAAMQLKGRICNSILRIFAISLIIIFTVFMVTGRIISGVHWITDIIGGMFISTAWVSLYYAISGLKDDT